MGTVPSVGSCASDVFCAQFCNGWVTGKLPETFAENTRAHLRSNVPSPPKPILKRALSVSRGFLKPGCLHGQKER